MLARHVSDLTGPSSGAFVYKLYVQIWYVVVRVLLDMSSRYKVVVICYWIAQHSQFNLQQWWCLLGNYLITVWVLGSHPHWSLSVVCFKHCWHILQVVGILPKIRKQVSQVQQNSWCVWCEKEMSVGNGLWEMCYGTRDKSSGVVACTIKILWLVVCVDPNLLDKL